MSQLNGRLTRLATALISPFRSSRSNLARRSTRQVFQSLAVERLEDRRVMAAPDILNLPATVTLQAGAPLQIALDGVDADGDDLTYTISVEAQFQDRVQAQLRTGRSVEIEVNHASNGVDDPAFTGSMILQLFEDLAPRTTGQFLTLAGRNPSFFEDIIFHRVLEGFVIQGGDPTGTGTGGSDLPDFDDEFHVDLQHTIRGLLSMAKSSDDTNNSQFFVTLAPTRHLDFNHSIFGLLVEGDTVLEQIANVAVGLNDPTLPESPSNARTRPTPPVTMTDVTVFEDMQNGAFTLKTLNNSFTGMVNVNVTVSDGTDQVTKTIAVNVVADTTDNTPFLGTIPPIMTRADTPTTVTIPSIDADGGLPPMFQVGLSSSSNLEVSINASTGVLTVTPRNGITGVHQFLVGVQHMNSDFDLQEVPVYIAPAAPSLPDLQAEFDSGSSFTDNVTRLDNTSQANQLRFVVNDVTAGAQVQLFAGNMLIGEGIVAAGANSITITTNGAFDLTDGQHSITAVQTLVDQEVEVGNLIDTVDLVSQASAPLALTIDTAAPAINSTAPTTGMVGATFTYNVQADGEGTTGFTYSFVESPAQARIDPATGVITWIPSTAQIGNQNFRVRASDPAGNPVEQPFTVAVVAADNDPPEIDTIDDATIDVGELLTFTVMATDPDSPQASIQFSLAAGAPVGAAIDPVSGIFTWTPTATQAGVVHSITVQATDGTSTGEDIFQVTVVPLPITFQVIDGDLVIPGTAGDDTVTIRGTNVAGQFEVSGTLGAETVSGVTRGIRADLGGGNDRVSLSNVYTAGPISIDAGEGNDVVRLGDEATVSSAQNLTIDLGGGDDVLHMQRVYIAGDLTADGGAGNDVMLAIGVAGNSQFWLGSSSAGATTVRGGDGDDTIQAIFSFVVGPWKIEGGAGNDGVSLDRSATSGDVTVSGGDGHDLLSVDTNYFVTSLTLNGNAGSDNLLLKNSIILQSATLLGSEGNDNAEVTNIIARGLMVSHGAGQDSAAVRASLLQNLFADLGDGNDFLIMQSNQIFGSAEADGGLGLDDRLVDQGNLMRPARKRRFETFG